MQLAATAMRPCAPTAHHGHTLPTYRDTPAHAGNAGATGNYPVANQTDAGHTFNRDVLAIGNAENAIARVLFELRKPQPDNARALKLAQSAMLAIHLVSEVVQ